jgi:hypothetical protein
MGTIGRRRRMAFAVPVVFAVCLSGPAAAAELPAVDDPLTPPAEAERRDTTAAADEVLGPLAEPLAPVIETLSPATEPDAGVTDPAADTAAHAAATTAAAPPAAGTARSPAPEHRTEPNPNELPAVDSAASPRDAGAPEAQQGGQRRPAVAQAAADFSLPLGIAAMVIAFLLVQARLDRHDPKLLAASAHRGDALPFS